MPKTRALLGRIRANTKEAKPMNGDNMGAPHDDGRLGVRNYMSDAEAKSFHRAFMTSTFAFVVIAAVAHVLVWNWRPWGVAAPAPVAAHAMNMVAPATVLHS